MQARRLRSFNPSHLSLKKSAVNADSIANSLKYFIQMLITHPTPSTIQEAIKLAFCHLSADEFPARRELIMSLIDVGMIELEGFFIGVEGGVVVGVLISQLRPDGLMTIWHPATLHNRPIQPFFPPLENYAKSHKIPAIVLLADKDQTVEDKTFVENGFEYISDMLMLVSNVSAPPVETNKQQTDKSLTTNLSSNLSPNKSNKFTSDKNDFRLQFVPVSEFSTIDKNYKNDKNDENDENIVKVAGKVDGGYCEADFCERLKRLIGETYVNTRDFPKLLSLTTATKMLDEYRRNNFSRPDLCFVIRKLSSDNNDKVDSGEVKDVGVLLLLDMPPDQIELTYMGLVEDARGQGYANEIIKFARDKTVVSGRKLITTAVDEQNTPALQSYLKQGFVAWDRKKIYAKIFS
ncbi:MAG: GNAT family N-acetyltransferase [Planctomycetaceae bacterium]|jgi:GNAT superfamily N-acetyltransferase|nr:GNAT family N-acetyltransferase [Planctomycetaceae bacterium]